MVTAIYVRKFIRTCWGVFFNSGVIMRLVRLSLLLALGTAGVANAALFNGSGGKNYYVKVDAGYSVNARKLANIYNEYPGGKKSLKSVYFGGAGLGVYIDEGVRADLTATIYQTRKFISDAYLASGTSYVNKQHYESVSVVLNGYVDVWSANKVSAYLNGGLGMAQSFASSLKMYGGVINGAVLAPPYGRDSIVWNLGGGVSYKVCSLLSFDLGYRYANLGRFGGSYFTSGAINRDIQRFRAHEGTLSARLSF
jgi:opacity protein-like surface antigen